MLNRADAIARGFDDLGISINSQSRLGKQIAVYVDPSLPQFLEPSHPLFQTAVEATRDLNQIAFALRQLQPVVPVEILRRQFARLQSDRVLPQEDSQNSPGRDAQCEVFVAALCQRAGLQPVFDESPDIRCVVSSDRIGVAVKRIKSPPESFDDRFMKRVREAAKQIDASGLPGVIVADVSRSLNPTNWRVPMEVTDEVFGKLCDIEMAQFPIRYGERLNQGTKGTKVAGIVVLNHNIRCTPQAKWQFELYPVSIGLAPYNQRRRRLFACFDDQLKWAVQHPD